MPRASTTSSSGLDYDVEADERLSKESDGRHWSVRMGSRPGLAPLFLRVALGLTFLWAGLGKIADRMEVTAPDAAALQTRGVVVESVKGEGSSGGQVQRVHAVTLVLHHGAEAGKRADGTATFPLVPTWAAQGNLPMYLAWAAAIAEVAGGMLVLAGLFTRLGASMLAAVMCGAIWLTQVGPAMQSGKAMMGFLPDHPPFDGAAWIPLLWQLCLLMSSLALACLGSGWLSLDRALFPPRFAAPAKAAPAADD